ncbi:hypothetical protein HY772_04775, partial [Candidatus Woesearchaeota archaeon]|nr:hypothetical protein [Candidatus Woesearchaeota archaeon]
QILSAWEQIKAQKDKAKQEEMLTDFVAKYNRSVEGWQYILALLGIEKKVIIVYNQNRADKNLNGETRTKTLQLTRSTFLPEVPGIISDTKVYAKLEVVEINAGQLGKEVEKLRGEDVWVTTDLDYFALRQVDAATQKYIEESARQGDQTAIKAARALIYNPSGAERDTQVKEILAKLQGLKGRAKILGITIARSPDFTHPEHVKDAEKAVKEGFRKAYSSSSVLKRGKNVRSDYFESVFGPVTASSLATKEAFADKVKEINQQVSESVNLEEKRLYHVTSTQNIEDIFAKGLQPIDGGVWFNDSRRRFGRWFYEGKVSVVLRVFKTDLSPDLLKEEGEGWKYANEIEPYNIEFYHPITKELVALKAYEHDLGVFNLPSEKDNWLWQEANSLSKDEITSSIKAIREGIAKDSFAARAPLPYFNVGGNLNNLKQIGYDLEADET